MGDIIIAEEYIAFSIPMFYVILKAYQVVMVGLFGSTLGKMATGIRVVNDGMEPPGIGQAILREVAGNLISLVLLIPYWLLFSLFLVVFVIIALPFILLATLLRVPFIVMGGASGWVGWKVGH